jgi:hypothetical protein
MLGVTGCLAACCLGLRSPIEFVLAVYVIGWTWLVAVTFALSPTRLLTREWLLTGLAVGLVVAFAVWNRRGRPSPPPIRPALVRTRLALVAGAAATAGVLAAPLVWDLGERAFFKAGLVVGTPHAAVADMHLALNTTADAAFAWYGPLGALLLAAGSVTLLTAARGWRERVLPLALGAAPWVLVATL